MTEIVENKNVDELLAIFGAHGGIVETNALGLLRVDLDNFLTEYGQDEYGAGYDSGWSDGHSEGYAEAEDYYDETKAIG